MWLRRNWIPLLITLLFFAAMLVSPVEKMEEPTNVASDADSWTGAPENQVPISPAGDEIRYGRQLVAHTALYFGPHGTIAQSSNGMNCQNCHLEAGTKPWGNNFGAVASTYPKFRDRSGTVETIEKRVNDCFERSLNGRAIDSTGHEMRAIVAYIKWLGSEIPKGTKPKGTGIISLVNLQRPADPERGSKIFTNTCERCHGKNGEGQLQQDGQEYTYPPLWGEHSFNNGAGLMRLSRIAGYIKANMPVPVNYHNPELSDADAWDVAAYVVSRPRPAKDLSHDWPDISKKPFDHPFGPYKDTFPEIRHKFGPFPGK